MELSCVIISKKKPEDKRYLAALFLNRLDTHMFVYVRQYVSDMWYNSGYTLTPYGSFCHHEFKLSLWLNLFA